MMVAQSIKEDLFVWPCSIVLAEYVWQQRLRFSGVSVVETLSLPLKRKCLVYNGDPCRGRQLHGMALHPQLRMGKVGPELHVATQRNAWKSTWILRAAAARLKLHSCRLVRKDQLIVL
ncbi:hypothetical protein RHMOL_Rhmol08G0036900 [Rhododendron molle]|uniref:Uncharacterized protein n=1 Tax=Rhododendron molle TaxID=49168 RepID=A0ACC0MJQ1_RHOML|nr:hypothetical protein RHMOL_Rhmol08G0036900 [Rhododendron molle]